MSVVHEKKNYKLMGSAGKKHDIDDDTEGDAEAATRGVL